MGRGLRVPSRGAVGLYTYLWCWWCRCRNPPRRVGRTQRAAPAEHSMVSHWTATSEPGAQACPLLSEAVSCPRGARLPLWGLSWGGPTGEDSTAGSGQRSRKNRVPQASTRVSLAPDLPRHASPSAHSPGRVLVNAREKPQTRRPEAARLRPTDPRERCSEPL